MSSMRRSNLAEQVRQSRPVQAGENSGLRSLLLGLRDGRGAVMESIAGGDCAGRVGDRCGGSVQREHVSTSRVRGELMI